MAFEAALEGHGRSQQIGGGQEDDHLSLRPAKYRPYRPHRHEYSDLQDFLAGGIVVGYRPRTVGDRLLRQVSSVYRPDRM